MQEPRLFTIPEAASELKVSRSAIYRLITAGQLKAVHIGRSVRIRREELERFLESASDQSTMR